MIVVGVTNSPMRTFESCFMGGKVVPGTVTLKNNSLCVKRLYVQVENSVLVFNLDTTTINSPSYLFIFTGKSYYQT